MPAHSSTTKKCTFRRLKQYRCQGFGDCDMVFSRSEHLARHVRKHTGEKPFTCEFPDCNKQFSRFDNMRQHAQTHQRFRKHNYNSPVGVQIQPRPSQPITLGTDQEELRTKADSPPVLPYYSSTTSNVSQHGLVSPISLSGTFEEQQQQQQQQDIKVKQVDPECKQDLENLTQDELDALDGLNQFRQSPQAAFGPTTGYMIKIESD